MVKDIDDTVDVANPNTTNCLIGSVLKAGWGRVCKINSTEVQKPTRIVPRHGQLPASLRVVIEKDVCGMSGPMNDIEKNDPYTYNKDRNVVEGVHRYPGLRGRTNNLQEHVFLKHAGRSMHATSEHRLRNLAN